jgi:hypothetical protein
VGTPRTPDMFDGWFDNQATQQREHWDNGVMGRYSRKNAIAPHAHHKVMRLPWGHFPDLPQNAGASSHG